MSIASTPRGASCRGRAGRHELSGRMKEPRFVSRSLSWQVLPPPLPPGRSTAAACSSALVFQPPRPVAFGAELHRRLPFCFDARDATVVVAQLARNLLEGFASALDIVGELQCLLDGTNPFAEPAHRRFPATLRTARAGAARTADARAPASGRPARSSASTARASSRPLFNDRLAAATA